MEKNLKINDAIRWYLLRHHILLRNLQGVTRTFESLNSKTSTSAPVLLILWIDWSFTFIAWQKLIFISVSSFSKSRRSLTHIQSNIFRFFVYVPFIIYCLHASFSFDFYCFWQCLIDNCYTWYIRLVCIGILGAICVLTSVRLLWVITYYGCLV